MQTGDPNQSVVIQVEAELKNMQTLLDQFKEMIDKLGDYASKRIGEEIEEAENNIDTAGRGTTTTTSQKSDDAEKQAKQFQTMAGAMNQISNVGISVIQKTFSMVEAIYAQLKKSSPLLQAVEQLFNLAWTLFFMPIGNKLGEMLIPAVIQMVDDVMDIWDAFEGMSLEEMFEYAIKKGVEILSTFILSIADLLKNQSGLVGAIGKSLDMLGNFIENTGAQFLEGIVNLMTFIIDNLKEIIATIIAFKVASLTMQALAMYVEATSNTIGGWLGAGIIAATAGTAFVASELAMTSIGVPGAYAEGGYIPSTPGGQLAIVGEGGEGEYIIPESKISNVGGNITNVFYSYSTEELKNIVKEVISEEVSLSRLKGGF